MERRCLTVRTFPVAIELQLAVVEYLMGSLTNSGLDEGHENMAGSSGSIGLCQAIYAFQSKSAQLLSIFQSSPVQPANRWPAYQTSLCLGKMVWLFSIAVSWSLHFILRLLVLRLPGIMIIMYCYALQEAVSWMFFCRKK